MNDLYIMHYGVGHDKGGHSGRYPWGSGENNRYGGVDLSTTKKDLFKLNDRTFKDVASDMVVINKIGSNTNLSEEDVFRYKKDAEVLIKNASALTVGMLMSSLFGVAGTLALRGYYTYKDLKEANNYIDEYKDIEIKS